MSTYLDYLGRTHDVLCFQPQPSGSGRLTMSLGERGEIVTGVQKAAQRFLLLLLTPKGSIPYAENVGCSFLTDLSRGGLRSVADVYTAFSAALLDIYNQFLDEESPDDPADEQFSDAEIISVRVDTDTVYLVVRVSVESGDSTQYITPLSITV